MKNTALITITTIHRTWVLPLGKAARIFLTTLSIVIVCSIAIGTTVIYQFSNRIDTLESKKQELAESVVSLNSSAETLQQKIQSQEFTLVKLQELEQLAGTELDDNSDDTLVFSGDSSVELSIEKQNQILKRIGSARESLSERKWLLQNIPSGLPLVKKTYITSGYGKRTHPITKRIHTHYGLDFQSSIGDDIISTADGVVEYSSFNTGGYGHMIRVRHNYGFTTVYAHLNKRLVKQGEVVTKGQVIGKSGNSGISTGPHLHYEIIFLKKKLNPKRFTRWSLDNYDGLFNNEKNVQWSMVVDQVKYNLQKIQDYPKLLPTSAIQQIKSN